MRNLIFLLMMVLLLSCNDRIDREFKPYLNQVPGLYLGKFWCEIGGDIETVHNFNLTVKESTGGNYEFVFDPIVTPDSTYQLDNVSFELGSSVHSSIPSAAIIFKPGQDYKRGINHEQSILVGREDIVIRFSLVSQASAVGDITEFSMSPATKPLN